MKILNIQQILKQKGAYPYEYMNSFKRFNEKKLPARKYFFSSTKKGKIGNDGKISDGHVSIKGCMACEKIWDKFGTKNMGDYHDHYFKKKVLLLADVFERFIGYLLKILWIRSMSLFQFPRIKLGCYAKNDWYKIRKNIKY